MATNALRIASNADNIKKKIKSNYGWDINILTSDEEARLSFLGTTFPFTKNAKIMIDIGGGNTEIIIGNKNIIDSKNSFNIRAVSFSEKLLKNTPPTKKEINIVIDYVQSVFYSLKQFRPQTN